MNAYLDHAATSPLRPEVREAMLEAFDEGPANPSSVHRWGRRAQARLDTARHRVAASLDVDPRGVVFTSGATEALHLAIRGLRTAGGRVAISTVEHPCVDAAVAARGGAVTRWGVDRSGAVQVGGDPVDLMVVQAANHESGILQDLDAVASAHPEAWLVVDAVQAASTGVRSIGSAQAARVLSGHKLGGPVGVGVLVLPPGMEITPMYRGSQERGRRGGTVPVALAAGFAAALGAAARDSAALSRRAASWQARLDATIREAGGRVVGDGARRVPTHTLGVFDGLPGEAIVTALDLEGVGASVGAACASGAQQTSAVLEAMGDPSPSSAVRLSTGWSTIDHEIDCVARVLPAVVSRLRAVFG